MRRIGSDKLQLRDQVRIIAGARKRLHPAAKVSAGNSEQRSAAADKSDRRALIDERHAVVFVAHAQVQREVPAYFVVILEEQGELILMPIVRDVRIRAEIIPMIRVGSIDEVAMIH